MSVIKWLIALARYIFPDLTALARKTKSVQVLTISYSHYCELACWALSFMKISYQEHGYAPGQHVPPSLAFRVGNKAKRYLSTSSRVTKARLDCDGVDEKEVKRDSSARATAVPFAVLPDGTVCRDSWEIVAASGLPDTLPELKKRLDEELGPLARQYAYSFILQPRNVNVWDGMCTCHHHWLWVLYWKYLGGRSYFTDDIMAKLFLVHNPAAIQECKDKLVKLIRDLDAIVAARKGEYLEGDSPGTADLALASLMGPLVFPDLYCRGVYIKYFNQLLVQDAAYKAEVDYFRSTVSGQYALKLYDKHRLQ